MIKKSPKSHEQEIRKKLSNIRDLKQLQKLLIKVDDQNKNLVKDIKLFKDKIDELLEKQNSGNSGNKERQERDKIQIEKFEKVLGQKYKQMKKLKKQLQKNDELEDVKNTKEKLLNEQVNVEKKIKEYKKQISDIQVVIKKLNKTFEEWQKEDNVNEPKIKELAQENKEMRQRISQILKKGKMKEYESIKVQTTIFDSKKRVRDNQVRKSMFNLKSQPLKSKRDIIAEYQLLDHEVKELKKQVQTIEQNQEVQKYERMGMRDHLKKQNKEQVKLMKNLQTKKTKALRQNNYYKKKWLDLCKHVQRLRNRKQKVQNSCQVSEFVDEQPLRREYAGVLGRNRSDDRLILKDCKTNKIVGLTIYETERGLSAIQAHYDSQEQSYLPLPPYYIAKCKTTKIGAGEDDFFKLFKVKYNSIDGRVIKIQARSNKNIRYQYGDKKPFNEVTEGDTVYGFDIRIHEYPVCFFASYVNSKGNYYMQGMGVEINDLQ